jgi:hypothetical protein
MTKENDLQTDLIEQQIVSKHSPYNFSLTMKPKIKVNE